MFEVFKKYLLEKNAFTDDELEMIESASVVKKLRKKQYLLQEGDVWKYNAFICKGSVKVYYVGNKGEEHILRFGIENWWAGDRESYTTEKPSKLNIDAIEDTVLLLWTKPDFDDLLSEIPALKTVMDALVSNNQNANQNRIIANITFSAEEKYHDFLQKYPDISNRVPHYMIASYLGVSRETLSRIRANYPDK